MKSCGMQPGADDLGCEAARQLQASGSPRLGEVAQSFQLSEVEREAEGLAQPAQDAALQGDRLRVKPLQLDTWGCGSR